MEMLLKAEGELRRARREAERPGDPVAAGRRVEQAEINRRDAACRAAAESLAREREETAELASAKCSEDIEREAVEAIRKRIVADSRARNLAMQRATVEAEQERLARERLDAERKKIEEQKARELAEREAEALVQIRIQTERMLTQQALQLAEAERAAEMAAIARRNAELEAARVAQQRQAAEVQARQAALGRSEAERLAVESANTLAIALAEERAQAEERLVAESRAHADGKASRTARWQALWAGVRLRPLALVAVVALAGGFIGGGTLVARFGGAPLLSGFGTGADSIRLRLDEDAAGFGKRAGKLTLRSAPIRPRS